MVVAGGVWLAQTGIDVSPRLQLNLAFQVPECLDCSVSVDSVGWGSTPSYVGDTLLLEKKWGCWFGHLLLPDAYRMFKYETMGCSFIKYVECFFSCIPQARLTASHSGACLCRDLP